MWLNILLLTVSSSMLINSRRHSRPLSKRFDSFKLMNPDDRKRLWVEPPLSSKVVESAPSLFEDQIERDNMKEPLLRMEHLQIKHAQEIEELQAQFDFQLRAKNEEIHNLRSQLDLVAQGYESRLISSDNVIRELQDTISEQKRTNKRLDMNFSLISQEHAKLNEELNEANKTIENLTSKIDEKDSILRLKEKNEAANANFVENDTRLQTVSQELISAQIMINYLRSRLLKHTSAQYLEKFDRKMKGRIQDRKTRQFKRGLIETEDWVASYYQAKL